MPYPTYEVSIQFVMGPRLLPGSQPLFNFMNEGLRTYRLQTEKPVLTSEDLCSFLVWLRSNQAFSMLFHTGDQVSSLINQIRRSEEKVERFTTAEKPDATHPWNWDFTGDYLGRPAWIFLGKYLTGSDEHDLLLWLTPLPLAYVVKAPEGEDGYRGPDR